MLDLALLEAPEGHPVNIQAQSLISHGAIVHGAEVHSQALVGIGAIILDGAVISSGCIIGAGSIVTPGMRIPLNSLALGVPAKVMRMTIPEERRRILVQLNELRQKSLLMKEQIEERC